MQQFLELEIFFARTLPKSYILQCTYHDPPEFTIPEVCPSRCWSVEVNKCLLVELFLPGAKEEHRWRPLTQQKLSACVGGDAQPALMRSLVLTLCSPWYCQPMSKNWLSKYHIRFRRLCGFDYFETELCSVAGI